MKMKYKNYQIRRSDYASGYFEAVNLKDCDAKVLTANSIEKLKTEIDET